MLQIDQTENFARGWHGAQALNIQHLDDVVTALTHGMRDQPESVVRGVTEKLDILEQVGLGTGGKGWFTEPVNCK